MAASNGAPKRGARKPSGTSSPHSGASSQRTSTRPAAPRQHAAKPAAKSTEQQTKQAKTAKPTRQQTKPTAKTSTKHTRGGHGTFASRIVNRRQRSRATHQFARLRSQWIHGSAATRTRIATVGVLAAIVAVALIITVVRFVTGRIELADAKARQVSLTETYDFNPGDIISDGQFFNGAAMNEAQVQAFLDEQGAQCTKDSCLRTRKFNVERRAANDYCREYPGAKEPQSAAAIITAAATACDVSPKVLLTMLQKEQQLVSATNPKDFQFKSAMGLSCPDDDHCDPAYAGFFNQVFGSAERYQYYVRHEDEYGFHAKQLNFIRFNPDVSCGGANVYIENKATALLYIYTPYQPNDAALAAGAGEGDACSTYGNRNFSIIYSGWFGDPRL